MPSNHLSIELVIRPVSPELTVLSPKIVTIILGKFQQNH